MWSCNGSASLAVCPERRVLPIVTLWAAADHPLAEDSRRNGPITSLWRDPQRGLARRLVSSGPAPRVDGTP
jgi:hypothetical protein